MFKKNPLIILVAISAMFTFKSIAHSKTQNIDSLKKTLKSEINDTLKAEALIKLGDLYEYSYPDSAIIFYKKTVRFVELSVSKQFLIEEARKLVFQKATALRYLGIVYMNKGETDTALHYYEFAAKTAGVFGFMDVLSAVYTNLGSLYSKIGKHDISLNYHYKSLKLKEKVNDKKGIADCNSNIGNIYGKQKSFEKALTHYKKAYTIHNTLNDNFGKAIDLNNIGNTFYGQNLMDSALRYYNQSLEYFEKINHKHGIASCLNNIGIIEKDIKNYDEAIHHYNRALQIAIDLQDRNQIALVYINLAKLNIAKADSTIHKQIEKNPKYYEAIQYANKALNIAIEIQSLSLRQYSFEALMQAYGKLGNFQKAFENAQFYIENTDSIFNTEKSKAIAEAEQKFESEKKQILIDKLEKEKQVHQLEFKIEHERYKKQRLFSVITIFGLMMAAILSIYILTRLIKIKKQNAIIESHKLLAEKNSSELSEQNEKILFQRNEIIQQHKKLLEQNNLLETHKKQITDSIKHAGLIQNAVLPKKEFLKQILNDYFVIFLPKDIVSGDFYWASRINEFKIFTVADCTGHGVPGALMSMLGVSILNEIIIKNQITRPAEILSKLRETLIDITNQTGNYGEQRSAIDMSICTLNTLTKELQFAGANSNMYLLTKNKNVVEFNGDYQPIGIQDDMKPFANQNIFIEKGEMIYLFSDGYSHQFGGKQKRKFQNKKIIELLPILSDKSLSEQKDILENTFFSWKNNYEQIDDVTVLGVMV